VNFPLPMEHMHAASDDLTRSRAAAPPENPGVHCKDISLASRARQVDETTLSTSDASPGDYMDWEPIATEYDVASEVLNGITSDFNIVEKLARFFSITLFP
jgi:hypothetical protein